ncbi:MAG: hypothetical protein QM784_26390 [Polyangiaceae bacterium]
MFRSVRRVVQDYLACALACLPLLACGGRMELPILPDDSDDSPEDSEDSVTVARFLFEMTAAVCDNRDDCCAFVGKRPSEDCKTQIEAQWKPVLEAGASRAAKFDGRRARSCIEAHRRAWTQCSDRKVESYRLDEACLGMFEDRYAVALPGQPCEFSMDCKDSYATQTVCVVTSDHRSYCEQRTTANVGEACGRSPDGFLVTSCNDGLVCSNGPHAFDGPVCRARAPQGSLGCISLGKDWCGVNLTCDEAVDACRPATAFGEACSNDANRCEQFCDGSGHCRPAPDLLTALFCR